MPKNKFLELFIELHQLTLACGASRLRMFFFIPPIIDFFLTLHVHTMFSAYR